MQKKKKKVELSLLRTLFFYMPVVFCDYTQDS